MKVLLLGCGRTGKSIAKNIIDLNLINKLVLYSRTIEDSKLVASELNNPKVEILESLEKAKNIDYIIITLSGMTDAARTISVYNRSNTYDIRQDELIFNLGALVDLTKYLDRIDNKASIIVVTNPVDEITNYLRIILKNKRVIGFGLELDAIRYSKFLGRKVLCIGTHGRSIPLINGKSEKMYDDVLKRIDSELLSYVRKHGIPYSVAGEAFRDFFERLNSKNTEIIHASYYLNKPFCGVNHVSISLPFKVKNGKVLGVSDVNPNVIEKKRFLKFAKDLKRSIDHILITHKKLLAYK